MKKVIMGLIVSLIIAGCGTSVEFRRVVSNYYLIATDDLEQLSLCQQYSSNSSSYPAIITETVFAVGYNTHYIIAKQHPNEHGEALNKNITNYYILPLDTPINSGTLKPLIGPLDSATFDIKRNELGIKDIKFTVVYKELE